MNEILNERDFQRTLEENFGWVLFKKFLSVFIKIVLNIRSLMFNTISLMFNTNFLICDIIFSLCFMDLFFTNNPFAAIHLITFNDNTTGANNN